MTQQDMVRELSEIDPEWGEAYAEEQLEYLPEGPCLSDNLDRTFTWIRSKKGVSFWMAVYHQLVEMGK